MRWDNESTTWMFFLNGINCILGWTAVLVSLDFFAQSFPAYNVCSYIALPLFSGYLLVAFLYHWISTRFRYVSLIVTGNTTVSVGLLALLLVSLLLPQTLLGFVLLLSSSFLLGLGGILSQLTFYAMINYLSQKVVAKFTVGTAVSGLVIACFRVLFTLIYGSDSNSHIPIVLYFSAAIAFNTLDMLLNIYFCRSQLYKDRISRFLDFQGRENASAQPPITEGGQNSEFVCSLNGSRGYQDGASVQQDGASVQQDGVSVQERASLQSRNYFRILYETSGLIRPYPLLICLNFVLSLGIYPGLVLKIKVGSMDDTWLNICYALAYNLGDTAGKLFISLKGSFNHYSLMFMSWSKAYFLASFTLLALDFALDDVLLRNCLFPFCNLFLFAFTVGYCTNGSFILAYKATPLIYKKYAGVLCGLVIQLGLMLGTLFQIVYTIILGLN